MLQTSLRGRRVPRRYCANVRGVDGSAVWKEALTGIGILNQLLVFDSLATDLVEAVEADRHAWEGSAARLLLGMSSICA